MSGSQTRKPKLSEQSTNRITSNGLNFFKVCRKVIAQYENSKKTADGSLRNPEESYAQAKAVSDCLDSLQIDPICVPASNDMNECLFQGDTNVYSCKEELQLYTHCVNDPVDYRQMLNTSTKGQRKPKSYNFFQNSAKYDKSA